MGFNSAQEITERHLKMMREVERMNAIKRK
jgi:hypothetical protein